MRCPNSHEKEYLDSQQPSLNAVNSSPVSNVRDVDRLTKNETFTKLTSNLADVNEMNLSLTNGTTDNGFEFRTLSDTDNDLDDLEDDFDEINQPRNWALKGNPTISHTRLDKLLQILRRRVLPSLPKTAKTCLKITEAKYEIEIDTSNNNEFVYFGIRTALTNIIDPCLHSDRTVELFFNVDGLQLFKSSSQQLWPILCHVRCHIGHVRGVMFEESFLSEESFMRFIRFLRREQMNLFDNKLILNIIQVNRLYWVLLLKLR